MFKLIVVDDNDTVRLSLVNYFNSRGIETHGFSDGQLAIQHVKHHHVDVILSDIVMPEVSGPEMMHLIQNNRRKPPLTVFMTGGRDIDIGATYLRGARAVLAKPIAAEDLLKLLTFFFQEREAARKAEHQSELDRIKLYETLEHARFGEFSRGLVHEVGSTIQKIIGRIDRISRTLAGSSPASERVEIVTTTELPVIQQHIRNLVEIITGLRKLFFEASEIKFSAENLIAILEESLSLCQAKFLERNIEVKFKFESPNIPIACNRMQIMQVAVNIINNAVDAISLLTEKSIIVSAEERGGMAEFSVTDSGPGIPVELRTKIMEPLFTTKGMDHGMGLGLSLCKKIIDAHHGEFFLDDQSTQTKFVIRLPKAIRYR